MKKILFYDCHTKAVKHLISLINELLRKQGFDTRLLHFESVYSPGFPKFIKIENLDCYDFSSYQTYNVKKILQKENPDLVVFFDKGGLLYRAGIKAAKSLKISTLYLVHGFVVGALNIDKSFYENIYSPSYYFNFKNFAKVMKLFWVYLRTSLAVDRLFLFKVGTYHLFYHLLSNPHKFYFAYPDEVKLDKIAVYGEIDKDYFAAKEHYPKKAIEVVGNLFLDATCLIKRKARRLKNKADKEGLFISQPLYQDYPSLIKKESFKNFLRKLFSITKEMEMKMVVKLHPREGDSLFKPFMNEGLIERIETGNLDLLIAKSDVIFSFNSTAIYNAILLEKSVVIPDFIPGFKVKEHYSNYEMAIKVGGEEKLTRMIRKVLSQWPTTSYKVKRQEFIRKFLYKDDGKAKERIVKLIKEMIGNK